MVLRQEQDRLAKAAAQARLAAEFAGRGRPGLPRRTLGSLLVRAGLWLMLPHPATPARSLD